MRQVQKAAWGTRTGYSGPERRRVVELNVLPGLNRMYLCHLEQHRHAAGFAMPEAYLGSYASCTAKLGTVSWTAPVLVTQRIKRLMLPLDARLAQNALLVVQC